MMKSNKLILVLVSLFTLASCSKKPQSSVTGWEYNNPKNGGFETSTKFKEQITGPGLMFIEGGSFSIKSL